jgi:hypothetical protein
MKARENPFNTERLNEIRYHLIKGTWEDLMKKLAGMNYRASITGPHGSGKSKLLQDIQIRLGELGFGTKTIFLNKEKRRLEKHFLNSFLENMSAKDIIFFDGADLMGRLEWRRFKRRTAGAAGLIVASHRAHLLPALMKCSTSPELLHEIVRQLLGKHAPELLITTEAIYHKHRGNMRDAIRELYDIYASRDGLGTLAVE